MIRLKQIFITGIVTACLTSCSNHPDSSGGKYAFCYWKTTFSFTPQEKKTWTEIGANHLYLRYFDVDWDFENAMAAPIGSINGRDTLPCHRFTPCVFLTNRVFEMSSNKQLDSLSIRIKKRIVNCNKIFYDAQDYEYNDDAGELRKNRFEERYSDVLIDCDWTEKTKDRFFYFLNRLKEDFPDKEITSTLRLWQYKDRKKAGIPPVKRCLLMCYNMQTANDYTVGNSIASLSELKKYVSGEKYPLKLDLVLPLFNWAVLFRNERFIGLLGEAAKADFDNNPFDYKAIDGNRYQLINDKVMGNFFARKGDEIRVEMVSGKELSKITDYLKSEIDFDARSRMAFFSWNELYIKNYGSDEIKTIFTDFSK